MNNSDEREGIAEINKLHQELEELATGALDRAIRIGELLSRAKSQVPHGQWLPWLTNNVAFSERTARNYMRVFENRATLKSANVADLGEAYQLLLRQSAPQTGAAPMTKKEAERLDAEIVVMLNNILELKIERVELHRTHPKFLKPSPEIAATLELLAKPPGAEELRQHLFCQILRRLGHADVADFLTSRCD